MDWLPRPRTHQADAAPPASHRSLALRPLLSALDPETRHAVLDLGPPVGRNLELLSTLGCRIRIIDLYRSLAAEPLDNRGPESCGALVARLLPFEPSEGFERVLLWGLFDYLRPHEITALMAHVASACRPRALAFAMVSTQRQLPAAPRRYQIEDLDTVSWTGAEHPQRPCPRYTQGELCRLMPGFKVRNSFLLRHGAQEYLFERLRDQ
jgi:hypothetical protein